MKKEIRKASILAMLIVSLFTGACSSDEDVATETYVTSASHIELKGEDNMRDLGGYVGTNGKRVLYGKLFRSGELSALSADDITKMESLKISTIVDLRTSTERTEKPDATIPGSTSLNLSLIDESSAASSTGSSDYMSAILSGQVDAEEMMLQAYVVDEVKIANWIKIFDLLEEGNSMLWHCTAGKDRAGMTSALVLASLGVDQQTIINDFMLSNAYLGAANNTTISYINSKYGAGMGEKLLPLLGVEEIYIQAFFADINTKYGNMDKFLEVLKVDRKKMRTNFLEK